MLKHLVKLADQLDKAGLNREAEFTDKMISKLAQEAGMDSVSSTPQQHVVVSGETMTSIVQGYSNKSLAENVTLNKEKNPAFNPDMIKPGSIVWFWAPQEFESN